MNSALPYKIRRLQLADVHRLLGIIRNAREEFGLAARVPNLLEAADYRMFDHYRRKRSAYFVCEMDGEVVGGAGIYPLAGGEWASCELQRMYLTPEHRGRGIGQAVLEACLSAARHMGFQQCYVETVSEMTTAIDFYQRNGFTACAKPNSDAGHSNHDCWLTLNLREAMTA